MGAVDVGVARDERPASAPARTRTGDDVVASEPSALVAGRLRRRRPRAPLARVSKLAAIGGVLCAVDGVVVMIAWQFDLLWLLRRGIDEALPAYNTGVAFIFTGVALIGAALGRRRLAIVGALFDVALAVAVLFEHVLNRGVGIDQLLFRTSVVAGSGVAGRVAPNTAVCLLAIGGALIYREYGPPRHRNAVIASSAAFVASVAGVALAGYASGVRSAYEWSRVSAMALGTVGLFLVVTAVLLALVWAEPETSRGIRTDGTIAPRRTRARQTWTVRRVVAVLAVFTFGPLAMLAYLTINLSTRAVRRETESRVQAAATLQARAVSARLEGIRTRVRSVITRPDVVAALGDGSAPSRDLQVLQSRLEETVDVVQGIVSVGLTDPGGTLIANVPSVPAAMGQNFSFRDWYRGASQSADVYVSEAVQAAVGGHPLVVAVAAAVRRPNGSVVGYVSLGYTLDGIRAFAATLDRGEQVSLTITDQRGVVLTTASTGPVSAADQEPVRRALAGATGVMSQSYPDGHHLVGYAPVPGIGWTVQANISESAAFEGVRTLRAAVDGVTLALAVAIIVALIFAAHSWQLRLHSEEDLDEAVAKLARSNDELARSNDELQQFAYAASHDLSEPLRAISGPVSLLARRYEGQLDADADQFIGFAVDGCQRMQRLIDGLLEFSRVGRVETATVPVDCNRVMTQVLAVLGPAIAEAGATVHVDPLPVVQAHPAQIAQVLQNLVANALKFVAAGVTPTVSVTVEVGDVECCISVIDNGIGIEPQHRERIFGMFKRLHGRNEYPGTGIGLTLVKKIVERQGGKVGVEDSPTGTGTRFWFTLPLSEEKIT